MKIEKYRVMSNDKEALAYYLQMVEATADGSKTIMETTEDDVEYYELQEVPPTPPKTEEELKEEIRSRRETECFALINRSPLWYARLTDAQIKELNNWYMAWLDAPETMEIPMKPDWLE